METEPSATADHWALDWIDACGVIATLLLFVAGLRALRLDGWYIAPLFGALPLAIPRLRRRWLGRPRGIVRAPASAVDYGAAFMIALGVLLAATAAFLLVYRRGELYADVGETWLFATGALSIPCILVGRFLDRRSLRACAR